MGNGSGPVVWRPISNYQRLNFKLGFFTSLFKSLLGDNFPYSFRNRENYQIVDKNNSTEFSSKAFRFEIKFHAIPGLSWPIFERPCPEGKRWGSTTYSMNPEISAISLAGRRRYRWIPFESLVFPVNQKILKKNYIKCISMIKYNEWYS